MKQLVFLIQEFGGLTVLAEIKKALPNEDLIYLGDTLNFPYGSKSQDEIIKYAIENTEFLISKNVKMIVVACGTATCYALNTLEEKFDIPIVGIIEPTISYIKQLNLKQIGVIATEGTIKNGAWEDAIKRELPNIDVINKACPMLATVAEEGKAKSKEGRQAIKEYMQVFKEKKVENIILGCTHYPIYIPIIKEELGYNVNLINTGETVAKYLKNNLLQSKNIESQPMQEIFLTKPTMQFRNIADTILNMKVKIMNK